MVSQSLQGQNLALTALCVPYSLGSGRNLFPRGCARGAIRGWTSSALGTKKPVKARFWSWLEPFSVQKSSRPFKVFPLCSSSSSLLLSSLELSDKKVYEPQMQARLGTASHFCKVVVRQRAVPVLPRMCTRSSPRLVSVETLDGFTCRQVMLNIKTLEIDQKFFHVTSTNQYV